MLAVLCFLLVGVLAECDSQSCGECTSQTWAELFHCGFCFKGAKIGCLKGSLSGPFEDNCDDWAWYGKGGVPGGTCCQDLPANCSTCLVNTDAGCTWCESQKTCQEKQTVRTSFCNATTDLCCSSLTSCQQCSSAPAQQAGCAWCASSNSCLPSDEMGTCAVLADRYCCNAESGCQACGQNDNCLWCDSLLPQSAYCSVKSTGCVAPSVPDGKCCSDIGDCVTCGQQNGDKGCSWCLAGAGQCVNSNLNCPGRGYSGKSCCQTNSGCSACQSDPACAFCLVDDTCRDREGVLCDVPADSLCCNAVQGGSCLSCVVDLPGCSFCTTTKLCSSGDCASPVVENSSSWQCSEPVLLNCEAMTNCGSCVSASGCVWIPAALVNGQPVAGGGLCFTGGLFGLSSADHLGYVVTAPLGFFWATCSLSSVSILILIGALSGGFVLVTVLIVCVCLCVRRRRRLRQAARASSGSLVLGVEDANNNNTSFSAATTNEGAAPIVTEPPKKKKKKKVARSVQYKPVDSVRATNTRYYDSRKK